MISQCSNRKAVRKIKFGDLHKNEYKNLVTKAEKKRKENLTKATLLLYNGNRGKKNAVYIRNVSGV